MISLRKPQTATRNPQYTLVSRAAWARTHLLALSSLVVMALLYIAALTAMPPEGLTHHDTGAKYLQVRNLRLTPSGLDWSINYPARALDPNLEFVPFNPKQYEADPQGRIYLQWPIFLGLLTRIPWKVLGFWGLYLVPLLAGLGTMWASYLLAQAIGVPRRVAWLSIPLVGLATPISIYSLLFFEHTLASMLVTFSLLALVLSAGVRSPINSLHPAMLQDAQAPSESAVSTIPVTPNYRLLAMSAVLLAVAVYFRSELYVLAFVFMLFCLWYAIRRRTLRPLMVWLCAFLLALIPLWAFYAINEGSILPLHATWYFAGGDSSSPTSPDGGIELPRLRYITQAGFGVIPDFLLGPQDTQKAPLAPVFPVWAVVSALLGVALCAVSAFTRLLTRLSQSLWPLSLLAAGLVLVFLPTVATLFSPQPYYNLHGFLLASPSIALALFPGSRFRVQGSISNSDSIRTLHSVLRTPQSVVLLYVALHVLIISALSGLGPISRNEWGQRYLLPAYPALTVLALAAGWGIWREFSARARNLSIAMLVLAGMLAATGVGFSVRGYVMLSDERAQVVAWQALARTLPTKEPLLTDTWWLPLNLAADFYTRPIMLAEGDVRIAKWADQMRADNVSSFGLISPNHATLTGPWLLPAHATPNGPPQQLRGMWLQRYSFTR